MTARRILLADADAFFVAVARMVDPEGAGRAPLLIVGGTRESRGVVCSASYEARKYGVRSAMPISRALRLCPQAMCVPVPRRVCGEKSREIRAVLERYAPVVAERERRRVVHGPRRHRRPVRTGGARGDGAANPRERRRAKRSCRYRSAAARQDSSPSSPSSAPSRSLVPAQPECTSLPLAAEGTFLETFELADIPLIGPRFQERLAKLGMRTVPDVLQYDVQTLKQWLSAREAEWLFDRVRGIDRSELEAHGDAKSISRDETFGADIDTDDGLAPRAPRARDPRGSRSSRRRHDGANGDRSDSRLRLQDPPGKPDARHSGDLGPCHSRGGAPVAGEAEKGPARAGATDRRGTLVTRRRCDG